LVLNSGGFAMFFFFPNPGSMSVLLVVAFITIMTACTSLGNIDELRASNRQNLVHLQVGMTKQEVLNVMGNESKTDHYANHEQLTVTNPYKSEMYQAGDNVLEVLYYYTDKKHGTKVGPYGWSQATQVTDDELTPILFEDGKVIGWGSSALRGSIQKYEIRVR